MSTASNTTQRYEEERIYVDFHRYMDHEQIRREGAKKAVMLDSAALAAHLREFSSPSLVGQNLRNVRASEDDVTSS